MKFLILTYLIFSTFLISILQADIVKAIQEKNGDVYILVRPKSGVYLATQQDYGITKELRITHRIACPYLMTAE